MPSLIDPSKPTDGVPAAKADLRTNLQTAKAEIEALQSGKADLGHTHTVADISDVGALAAKDTVGTADIDPGGVTADRLGDAAVTTAKLADDAVTLAKLAAGTAGRLLAYDAQGNPATIAQGAAGGLDADTLDGQQAAAFAAATHTHMLADVADAGALAGKSTVAAAEIDAEAVTTAKIASGAVTGTKLAEAAVSASKLASGAVTISKLASGAVDSTALANQAVATAKLMDGNVTTTKLADGAVTGAKLAANAVTSDVLAASAVTTAKLADGNVTTAKLADGAVTGAQLAANAVASDILASSAVTAAKLADGNVTTAKLADGAVTQSKLAADAVGAAQLQDGIPISMQGAVLSGPELRAYAETSPVAVISGGVVTLDLATGSVFEVILTENLTLLTLLGAPGAGLAGAVTLVIRQDATGGRTVGWPAAVKWAGGTPPAVTATADAIDVYTFVTRDGGATWLGFPGGQDFS